MGAQSDDGVSNGCNDCGAVYLYSFTDLVFSGGNLEATIGSGYTGAKDIDQTLDAIDRFGSSVSLGGGNRLAVSAFRDDGTVDTSSTLTDEEGAVYLFFLHR